MVSESDCLDALRKAADKLGHSPTKSEYEQLEITPGSSSIRRIIGGWNEAKEQAGLERFTQKEGGGQAVLPKPDSVEIPAGQEWEDLTPQQRCYYKHREHHIERKNARRKRLRRWFTNYKDENCSCVECGESHPAALDFHHIDEKSIGISRMVNFGYSKDRILSEIERCEVICANCHRLRHREGNDSVYGRSDTQPKDERRGHLREWITEYKRNSKGCGNCTESRPPLLDFHHPGEKDTGIARMVSSGRALDSIRAEIRRCDVLCANCHRRLHNDDPS